jgi:hypothetical protein
MSNTEVEVRTFKQQGGESLKDAWYRISNAHHRCTKCQASCTSQRNQKSELMERASTIHIYTSTPPLTCDGRRESQHVDTKEGDNNFTINCENQDLNTRPWALIPCQASCTSQHNQNSELMERASTIHLYTSTPLLTCDESREKRRSTRGT